jgi:hypothetical protein
MYKTSCKKWIRRPANTNIHRSLGEVVSDMQICRCDLVVQLSDDFSALLSHVSRPLLLPSLSLPFYVVRRSSSVLQF